MMQVHVTHPETLTFTLLAKPARKGMKAADEACYHFRNAADVFDLIRDSISSGYLRADDHRIASLAEICAFAFQQLAETHGEDLQDLARLMGFQRGAPEDAAPAGEGEGA